MTNIWPNHPSTYGQLIKRSLYLYKISLKQVLFLSVLLSICAFMPRIISTITGNEIAYTQSVFDPRRIWLIVVNLFALTIFVALLWRMHGILREYHEPLIEDFAIGARKAISVFLAAIIQALILFAIAMLVFTLIIMLSHAQLLFRQNFWGILFSMLILGGQAILILYISTLFIFVLPLIAIENKGVFGAIQKSLSLVWNHWWRTLTVQLTPWLYYLLLLILLKYIGNLDLHIYFIYEQTPNIASTVLQLILFIIFIPWVAAVLLVQLKDLELRKSLHQHATKTNANDTARI